MDFSLSETQLAVRDLAAQIFAGQATVDRLKEVERGEERIDRRLWRELAKANVLGLSVGEEAGGSGLGMIELCLVLEQQGRCVAPVPLLPTAVAAMTLARFGGEAMQPWAARAVEGEAVLTSAVGAGVSVRDGALDGAALTVPAAHVADLAVVGAADGIYAVDLAAPGVTRTVVTTTNRERAAHLHFESVKAARVGDATAASWMTERFVTGLAALQFGVASAALRMAADHTSARHQFGKPLSTFQGVALKAADAYIDTQAMEVTLWQAAWSLDAGRDARRQALVAGWWAAEAGQRVVHAVQHLHGGLGADVEYPVHRYFLWGKQIEVMAGGASAQLSALGDVVAEEAKAR